MARSLVRLADYGNPVVSLVVMDQPTEVLTSDPENRIQLVVRDPLTNSTHPNVVSMPTARLPRKFLDTILGTANIIGEYGETKLCIGEQVSSDASDAHHPLLFVIKSILARKLGVADALEAGTLAFRAQLVTLSNGQSWYLRGREQTSEKISMIGVCVRILRGPTQFPLRTASYLSVKWVPIPAFGRAVQSKDPSLVGLDAMEFCIHGLCVSSAYDFLASKYGWTPFNGLAAEAMPND